MVYRGGKPELVYIYIPKYSRVCSQYTGVYRLDWWSTTLLTNPGLELLGQLFPHTLEYLLLVLKTNWIL